MNIAYIQCDTRFNQWLLKKIHDKYVIEYTVQQIKILNFERIIAGIYNCHENQKLKEILQSFGGVDVELSQEENVNIRFLNVVIKVNADYVIRIGGDQLLIDSDRVNNIIQKMEGEKKDFFYEESAACVLPDIVSIKCLKKYQKSLLTENRYFDGLSKQLDVNRYELDYPMLLPFDYRVNSNEGYRICKEILENEFDLYDLSKRMMQNFNKKSNYLISTGIWGSWLLLQNSFFVDNNGDVSPWWAKSMTDFIKRRLDSCWSVFEWGSGNSTLFLSQHLKNVVSIEYDEKWYEKMRDILPKNVDLKYCKLDYDGNYCRKILEEKEKFDIVVIDGRDRSRCAENAVKKLKSGGIIIWDDTNVDFYEKGIESLKRKGFKQFELSSVTYQIIGWEQYTSIFYRDNNILKI